MDGVGLKNMLCDCRNINKSSISVSLGLCLKVRPKQKIRPTIFQDSCAINPIPNLSPSYDHQPDG